MTKPLLDLSGKIEPALVDVCASVAHCAEKLQIPYLVVGAFARDLVMHYGYGAEIQRATADIDFALQLPSWGAFTVLKQELIANGFIETKSEHRLIAPNKYPIDIVPFGDVADKNANIQWPPDRNVVMNVLGFHEALNHADQVILDNKRGLQIPVASPVGMTLLKFISWMDRGPHLRNKDAKDLAYLLSHYETIPGISDAMYADQNLMAIYGWDITLAAAHRLGQDAKLISSSDTATIISVLLNDRHPKRTIEALINEMGDGSTHHYAKNELLVNAFKESFLKED